MEKIQEGLLWIITLVSLAVKCKLKLGINISIIKTYYFFGLISYDKSHLVSSCLMDGDFLNYDFELHLSGEIFKYKSIWSWTLWRGISLEEELCIIIQTL